MTNYPQLFSLQDKIAVVLGAASGIGQASAHALGAMGAYVMCADRDESGAQATAQQIIDGGGAAGWMQTDAASGESIAQLAARVLTERKRIDIAVATPALNIRKLIVDYTED